MMLMRKLKNVEWAPLRLLVKNNFTRFSHVSNLGKDPNLDPDLDLFHRHRNGKLDPDPDRLQNYTDSQHCKRPSRQQITLLLNAYLQIAFQKGIF